MNMLSNEMTGVQRFLEGLRSLMDNPNATVKAAIRQELLDMEADIEIRSLLSCISLKGERAVTHQLVHFMLYPSSVVTLAGIPMSQDDTIIPEFTLPAGRADVIVFHVDGTATVVEVKDGAIGLRGVVAGIGQAGLYACQLGLAKGSIKEVRRALAWSQMRDASEDRLIARACEASGVIPVKLFRSEQIRDATAREINDRAGVNLMRVADLVAAVASGGS